MSRIKTSFTEDLTGKYDRLPEKENKLSKIGESLNLFADFYGFEKIHPSALEVGKFYTALSKAGLLTNKPSLSLKNKTEEIITLRLSGILPAVRMYLQHKMSEWPHPLKFILETEGFWLEKGREADVRISPEISLLTIGEEDPIADAEIIQVIFRSLENLRGRNENLDVKLNHTGCAECRPLFRSALNAYLRSRFARLCRDCKKSWKANPTEVFACREEKCQTLAHNAPLILDFLCETCKKYLRGFLEFLDEIGVSYILDPKFFKEGSYFGGVVFEIIHTSGDDKTEGGISAVTIIAEGGRISRAAEILASRRLDMVGATLFLEQAALMLEKEKFSWRGRKNDLFLAQLGDLAKRKSLTLLELLRKGGLEVTHSLGRDAIKSQLKVAEKIGAKIALILGQKEALDRTIIVRETDSGIQETIPQDKLLDFLKKKLNI